MKKKSPPNSVNFIDVILMMTKIVLGAIIFIGLIAYGRPLDWIAISLFSVIRVAEVLKTKDRLIK